MALAAVAVGLDVTTAIVSPHVHGRLAQGAGVRLSSLYLSFWLGGFIVGALAAMALGRVRGTLNARVVVAGVLWSIGILIGARLEFWLEMPPGLAAVPREMSLIDTGMRLPLGIAAGMGLAGVWCLATRTSWRAVGDGFSLNVALMIAFGRAGCLLAGCCTGQACSPWIRSHCLQYGSGSEAFIGQLERGLIDPTATAAIPVHPLPLYFALAAAGLTVMFATLVSRQAPPGSLLLAFLLWWPTSKILLEQLRGVPRPPGMMLGIPVVLLVLGLAMAVSVWRAARQGSDQR